MKNSTLITNSELSRRAIVDALDIDDVYVLSPPVDIESCLSILQTSDDKRKDIILVVSRIDLYKEIENTIRLKKILKDKNIGNGMKIVGIFTFTILIITDVSNITKQELWIFYIKQFCESYNVCRNNIAYWYSCLY
jgi:hypothetical protein